MMDDEGSDADGGVVCREPALILCGPFNDFLLAVLPKVGEG